jgi:hypothetical protein
MCTQFITLVKKEFMGHLNHNACTITGVVFASASTTMLHVFQNCQSIGNNLVRFIAFDIGNEANAAGVAFKIGGVKSRIACHNTNNHLKADAR